MKNLSGSSTHAENKIFAFDDFIVNVSERLVWKDSERLKIYPKTFALLVLLLEHGGNVVTKSEIFDKVWNDNFVEEVNLTVQISKLRKLLGENSKYIETVTGIGYRFNKLIRNLSGKDWQKIVSQTQFEKIVPTEKSFDHKYNLTPPGETGFSDFSASSELVNDLVAVLPFENQTEDQEFDFLADGLTENLINQLSRMQNIRVLARSTVFRYKNKTDDLNKIIKKLKVGRILTGSLQFIENTLSVRTELIETSDQTHLWGDVFQEAFTEIFDLQDKMASTIAEKLESKIDKNHIKKTSGRFTHNTESYRLYLKACYLLNDRSLANINKAIDFLQESVKLDKYNSLSNLKLIYAYISLYQYDHISYKKVKPIIAKILKSINKTDEETEELFDTLALIERELNWNLELAEVFLKKGFEINQNSVDLHYSYLNVLLCNNRLKDAWEETEKIIELDPLSARCIKQRARILLFMGKAEQAVEQLKEHLEFEPMSFETRALLGWVYLEMGEFDKSLKEIQSTYGVEPVVEIYALEGLLKAKMGKHSAALEIIDEIEKSEKSSKRILTYKAHIFAEIGETQKALDCLEKAFESHQSDIIRIKADIRFIKLRQEPRFKLLLQKNLTDR